MAKFKFTDSRITEIVAVLDETYDFGKVLDAHCGDIIAVKFTRDIEE